MYEDKEKVLTKISKTNINIIDVKILVVCFNESHSISEIQSVLGIAYKNLSPHLKKLEEMGLIEIKDHGLGRKKEVKSKDTLPVAYFMFGLICLYSSAQHLGKYKSLEKEIINYLKDNQINQKESVKNEPKR